MDGFKAPQSIPQDLLLIQDFIGVNQEGSSLNAGEKQDVIVKQKEEESEDIASSGDESDGAASEEAIAAELAKGGATTDEDDTMRDPKADLDSSDSSSESDSEDSDSDSDSSSGAEEAEGPANARRALIDLDLDDDEDPVPAAASGSYFTTKHEVAELEVPVPVPDVDEIGAHEVLEKVGEVMNILDRVAIVRGLPSGFLNRGSDRALDSDTLLVFNDRKVMGYIYETFGPTTQPLYQVKFSTTFPLDPERVRVGREVFHVPARSHFVFVSQIKAMRGSDASNVHDEEPGDDELEFSDDEAEAAYRSRLKRKRGESRARSAASSRAPTPNPTLMRDQELVDETYLSRNAYDEHGPYDIDFSAAGPSSSRPPPLSYDDPYGDAYTAPDAEDREPLPEPSLPRRPSVDRGGHGGGSYERPERGRGRGSRGGGGRGGRGGERGRGRGNNRGRDRGPQKYGNDRQAESYQYRKPDERSMSPTSLAIARVTGQVGYSGQQPQHQQHSPRTQNPTYPSMDAYPDGNANTGSWGYGSGPGQMPMQYSGGGYMQQQDYQPHQQGAQQNYGMQTGAGAAPFVQPHINPRFASAFGLPMPAQQGLQYNPMNINPMGLLPMQAAGYMGGGGNGVGSTHVHGQDATGGTSNWTADEWAVPVQERFLSAGSTAGGDNGSGGSAGEEAKNSNK